MRAGLQGEDHGCAARFVTRRAQRIHFGMRPAELLMPPFPYRFVAPQQHRAYEKIGGDASPAAPRKLERALHGSRRAFLTSLQTYPPALRLFRPAPLDTRRSTTRP